MGRALRSGRKIASLSPPKQKIGKTPTKSKPAKASTAVKAKPPAKARVPAKSKAAAKPKNTKPAPKETAKKSTPAARRGRKAATPKEESSDSEEEEEEKAATGHKNEPDSESEEGDSGSENEEESSSKKTVKKVVAQPKSAPLKKSKVTLKREATPPKKKSAPSPKKEESSSEDDDSSGEDEDSSSSGDDDVKKVSTASRKKLKSPAKKEESSEEEDGSSSSDDEAEKVTPAPLKKPKSPAKEEEDFSSDDSEDDEVKKVAPAPLKKSVAPATKDESSDEDDDDSDEEDGSSDAEENKSGFTDDNSNWLKPKQTKKMKLMSSDEEEDGDDDEFGADAASDDDDEEMLDVERQSRLIDAEMQLEREEAASELRRTIAQQTAVFHLPTAEELEEDENRVVPPSELRARIDDVLEVLAAFKDRREPGRSRSEYIERLGQDMAELFGYLQELVDYFLSMFGPNECLEFLEASDRSRPLVVRVNTLKARRKDLAAALMKRGVRLDPLAPWSKVGLKIHESTVPVGATPEYLAGHYMLQSAASMCPVMAMGVKPGDRVLDMSAAPGGKTSYICQLMRNKGVVIASDLKPERQKATVANLHRLGVRNAVTCCYDGRKIGVLMPNSFDRILLDAPCSGLGVISRDPSVKVQRTMPDVKRCAHLQKELLVAAIDALNHKSKKGGGYMVYSTCSVAVAENEEVINYLLSKRDVKLVDTGLDFGKPGFTRFEHKRFHPSVALTRRFYPHVHNMDGFYVAKIQKLSDKRKGVEEEDKNEQTAEKASNEVEAVDAMEVEGDKSEEKKIVGAGGQNQQQNAKKRKGKKKRGSNDRTRNDDGPRNKSKKISYAPRAEQQVQNVQKKKKTNAKVSKPRRMKITGM